MKHILKITANREIPETDQQDTSTEEEEEDNRKPPDPPPEASIIHYIGNGRCGGLVRRCGGL